MSGEAGDDGFLKRWSRLKHEARERPEPQTSAAEPSAPARVPETEAGENEPPVLPPVESLAIDSDFTPFLHPKVEEHVRRAALKKLFSDPRFNVMDGLDVYIDDYSVSEPLPEAMLGQLEQAKKILAWSREDAEARASQEAEKRRLEGNEAEKRRLQGDEAEKRRLEGPDSQDHAALTHEGKREAPDESRPRIAAAPADAPPAD
jgi:hypothetical protein